MVEYMSYCPQLIPSCWMTPFSALKQNPSQDENNTENFWIFSVGGIFLLVYDADKQNFEIFV